MDIFLTPKLEQFVNEKITSGEYNSVSEVICFALRLLKARDELKQIRCDEVRREVMKGVEEIKAGKFTTIESEEDIETLIQRITSKHK